MRPKYSIGILDMYKGESNQGMKNLHDLIHDFGKESNLDINVRVYDIRNLHNMPDLSHDAYFSTGGPGSPIAQEGWEDKYIQFILSLIAHNKIEDNKKFLFLICHSFQVLCHQMKLAQVCLRNKESFGVYKINKTSAASENRIFKKLPDPFWAVDTRYWQVIQPDIQALESMGAKILAIEKVRDHVPHERATMAIQFNDEIIGTQFHPEANAEGMIINLTSEAKKDDAILNHGIEKYNRMMQHLNEPNKIQFTQSIVIPNFLKYALESQLTQTTLS